jgi:ribose-phosphate pyrophosphokinase
MSSPPPALFSLSESRTLAAAVGLEADLKLASLEEGSFEGGEFKLRPLESVRGRTAFVLQSLAGTAGAPVSDRFIRLLFLLNGLRDAGATQQVALVPYLAFARTDRRTKVRDPINTRYVAQLLEASGADRLIALDVHNPAALENAFRIPVDHLSALPMMVDHFATRFAHTDLAIASPDVGGVKRAQIFRERLETRLKRALELVFIEKRRSQDVVSGGRLVGNAAGRTIIVIDDLCATGGTLLRAADACLGAGATAVHVAVTHIPLAAGLRSVLDAGSIASLVTTDSVGNTFQLANIPTTSAGKLVVLPIAPLFGQAVRRMVSGRHLAPLLERWPVAIED